MMWWTIFYSFFFICTFWTQYSVVIEQSFQASKFLEVMNHFLFIFFFICTLWTQYSVVIEQSFQASKFLDVMNQFLFSFFFHSLGIEDLIAKHVAHLFIRDPVSLFSEKIHQNDETDTDHFEVTTVVISWFPVLDTIKLLKIQTPEKFAVIILKFQQGGFIVE